MAEDKTLRDVPVGQSATVRRLVGEGAIKRRIMDMGITKGTDIYVRKVAPLGDPIEVTVRGFELSLRKDEAQNVLVAAARIGRREKGPANNGFFGEGKADHGYQHCPCRQPQLRQDDHVQRSDRREPVRGKLARSDR